MLRGSENTGTFKFGIFEQAREKGDFTLKQLAGLAEPPIRENLKSIHITEVKIV